MAFSGCIICVSFLYHVCTFMFVYFLYLFCILLVANARATHQFQRERAGFGHLSNFNSLYYVCIMFFFVVFVYDVCIIFVLCVFFVFCILCTWLHVLHVYFLYLYRFCIVMVCRLQFKEMSVTFGA